MNTTVNTSKNFYYAEEKIPAERVRTGDMAFEAYAKEWLETGESELSPKTYSRYCDFLKRINMGIGHIALNRLEPYHLTEFYKRLAQEGSNMRTGGGLSEKTVLHHHRLISVVLRNATREGLVPFNVADKDHIRQPRVKNKEPRFLNENEAKELILLINSADVSPKWRFATLFLLTTGMRRGELLGLEWSDVDFNNAVIHINRTSQYLSECGIITVPTKTKDSNRFVKLSRQETAMLYEYGDWWRKERTKRHWGRTDRLFLQNNGKPMHPDSVTDWIRKFCVQSGFKHFSPHSLRHTNISLLISMGIPLTAVSARAGHSRLSTTADVYAHSIKSAEAKAAEAVGGLLLGE